MGRVGWLRLAVIVGAALLLEWSCRQGWIDRLTIIPPSEMATSLWSILKSGKLDQHIRRTLGNVGLAFALSVVIGAAAGTAIHGLPRLRRALDPLMASYYAVPFFIFYPLLILIFGLNNIPIIVIGFMFAVVAMVLNTLNGLDRIPPVLIKTAHVMGMGRLNIAWQIKLPAAAPYLFTGVKLAVAYSFIGVIASEFILSGAGLGYSIAFAYNNFDNRGMYALMLFILILVTTINSVLHMWEQRMMRRRARS